MKYTHILAHTDGTTEKCNIINPDVYPPPSKRRYATVKTEDGDITEVSHRNLIEIPSNLDELKKESSNIVELFCNFFKRKD